MTPQEKARAKRLKNNFDLTPEEWDRANTYQKGLCWLCGKSQKSGKRLATDHCHRSGLVRGLLCSQCNRLLGRIERSQWTVAILHRLIDYLSKPPMTLALGRTVIGYAGRTGTKKQRLELKRKAKALKKAGDGTIARKNAS